MLADDCLLLRSLKPATTHLWFAIVCSLLLVQIPVIIAIIMPVCMGCVGLCTHVCSRRRKSVCWEQSDGDVYSFTNYWSLVAECE